MVDLDRFESQFRAAVKERPLFERPRVGSVLIVTDLEADEAHALESRVREFLNVLEPDEPAWTTVTGQQIDSVKAMLSVIEARQPDLIVSYRHLFEPDKDLPHSLGTYADMLIQALSTPVLLMPNPLRPTAVRKNTEDVVVITDHIVGDQRLVNWGLRFVADHGHFKMVNVEDDLVFRRYMDVIGKIPDIDTDTARSSIEHRLLHEAQDFLDAWAKSIQTDFAALKVDTVVRLGHTTRDYMQLVEDDEVDLVVFNTREEGQLAMHGIAYALAVELLDTPLLML